MKIEQTPKFQPIVITLQTASEAEAFWEAIRTASIVERNMSAEANQCRIMLSNWFSQYAQLDAGK